MLLSLIVSGIVCGALILIGVIGYLLDKSAERHDGSGSEAVERGHRAE
jgi:hypothetical protein